MIAKTPTADLGAFGGAAEGQIPGNGVVTRVTALGKDIPLEAAPEVARILNRGLENGVINPVDAVVAANAVNVEKIAPGGRPENEIPASLSEGAKPHKAHDWTITP